MKSFRFLVLAIGILALQPLQAQKHLVILDAHYIPMTRQLGGTAGYFYKTSERRAAGLKVTYSGELAGEVKTDLQFNAWLFDAVQRYRLAKKRKSCFYVDAGVSVLVGMELRPPNPGLQPIDPVPQAEYESYVFYINHWHTSTQVAFGLATAWTWEYALTKKFSLGASLLLNPYFDVDGYLVAPLMLPSVRSAYLF